MRLEVGGWRLGFGGWGLMLRLEVGCWMFEFEVEVEVEGPCRQMLHLCVCFFDELFCSIS